MDTLEHAALSALRHNLRTAVNQILGLAELLIEDASDTHNTAALDPLHEIDSTARAALSKINDALAGRESVDAAGVAALREKMGPRVERIEHCLAALRESREIEAPPEWQADFDRIGRAAAALFEQFGNGPAGGPAIAAGPARQDAEGRCARLLVVDDSAANRNILCRRLERLGYIVLLDILMPVMDGFAVLDRMRRDRRMQTVAVVVISSPDEAMNVARAIEMGADDYLYKPFHPILLRTRIEAVLERKRVTDDFAVR
jgi:CheY-like chemotaxis protein